MKRRISLLLILFILIGSTSFANELDSIDVSLNDRATFNNNPNILTSESIISLENLFKKLGMEYNWDPETNKVVAEKEGLSIVLTIGKRAAYINGNLYILNLPPMVSHGRLLTPFMLNEIIYNLDKEQDETEKHITMEEMSEVLESKNKEFISHYDKDNFVKMTINGMVLKIEAKRENTNGVYDLVIRNLDTWRSDFIDHAEFENGYINRKIDLSEFDLSDFQGRNEVTVVIKNNSGDSNYKYRTVEIYMIIDGENIIFELSPVFEVNYFNMIKARELNPEDYLSLAYIEKNEREELIELAKEITHGIESDYEKLKVIHDWVVNNIYYDYDRYHRILHPNDDLVHKSSEVYISNAYNTYKNRRGVCQGYAELTSTLCRGVGIPARTIRGYALGISTSGAWDEESLSSPSTNHAWNEAFVDNRWVILDTTWDTFNRYRNGHFSERDKRDLYFDISIELLSNTHSTEQ